MRRRTFQPRFERLETRTMMAGDVTATFTSQNLSIREDSAQIGFDNAIKLRNLPGAITRVEGMVKPDGTQTLINGAPYQDFQWVRDLSIVLGAGDDQVLVDPYYTPSYVNVQIDVAAPLPILSVDKLSRFSTGDRVIYADVKDNDIVNVGSITTSGALTITTGQGDDQVTVMDFNIGGVAGYPTIPKNLSIYTGAGADTVFVGSSPGYGFVPVKGNLVIQTYSSLSELNADSVTLNYVDALSTTVRLGGGDDTFRSYATSANVDAGAGNDKAYVSWGTLQIQMGEGDDTLDIDGLTASSSQQFSGGGGTDRITYKNVLGTSSQMQLTEWEYINGWRVWPVLAYDLVYATVAMQ